MSKIKRLGEIFFLWISASWSYLYRGYTNGSFFSYLLGYIKHYFLCLEKFSKTLEENVQLDDYRTAHYHRYQQSIQGLHGLLPNNNQFFYSILVAASGVSKEKLQYSLESALTQTAPYKEVLVGVKKNEHPIYADFLLQLKNQYPHLHLIVCDNECSESEILNILERASKGNYLFILYSGDWLRCDLLYRYEQTLRLLPEQENRVLFCDEYQINAHLVPIPKTRTLKPEQPHFPYIFNDDLTRTLLIPKSLWRKVDGLSKQAYAFDLPLQLELQGARFYKVPVYLYAVLEENKNQHPNSKDIIEVFNRYSLHKHLNWTWTPGYSPQTIRAIPELNHTPKIHAVMLYKDQGIMTLSATQHLLNQSGVEIKMTAIDNNSHDRSIAQQLEKLGVEVIRVEEPFNYSRLNNIAVRETKIGQDCDHILFLNNDVDLEVDTLQEMSRWIEQPGIGLVGCRLNYPNGLLQHGGVVIKASRAAFIKSWHHTERLQLFEKLKKTNFLRITAAVTAACCLVNRKIFLEIEGFDELWFPVAFSDTALAVKIRAKGLHCLYTPFAVGIHHESISRKKVNIEDYEALTWVHRKYVQKLWQDEKIHFDDLINTEY